MGSERSGLGVIGKRSESGTVAQLSLSLSAPAVTNAPILHGVKEFAPSALSQYNDYMPVPAPGQIFDSYIDSFNRILLEFVSANTTYLMGSHSIREVSPFATVSFQVEADAVLEPLSFAEIRSSSDNFQKFILSTFEERYVSTWQDLIDDLFSFFLDAHFAGQRLFSELKRRSIKVDFAAEIPIHEQVRKNVTEDFKFDRYQDRLRVITGGVDPQLETAAELETVHKHVLIRNANQHRGRKMDEFMIASIGRSTISMLDEAGNTREFKAGQEIQLSVPELYHLHRSVLYIMNTWRRHCG